jgi:hypothetical protein
VGPNVFGRWCSNVFGDTPRVSDRLNVDMPQARFVVSLPPGTWLGDLSAAYPEATFRLTTALEDQSRGVGLCWLTASDPDAVLGGLAERDDVSVVTMLHRTSTEAAVQFETDEPLLLWTGLDTGVPVEFPVEIRDARAVVDVVGKPSQLTDFGLRLDSLDVEFVREYTETDEQLTGKQYSLVVTAVELGYYDTPRECSLTDLAEAVGLAKSTVSETLHRAEGKLIKSFVGSDARTRELNGSVRS